MQQDLLTILKGYGINAIRLRTFVNPSDDPNNGHCSITETAAMAVRCKNAGLPVDLDFHFGDTWNSVGVQKPPAAWASLSYSAMLDAMSSYVYDSLNVMKDSGVTPGWIQIGNEINQGICGSTGSLAYHPDQMTGLLNAAYNQCKTVFPTTPVLIHLAQPQYLSKIENFFDTYQKYGGQWDISAFSSYGSGSATVSGIISNFNTCQQRYGKPVMQVEFGGRYDRASRTLNDLKAYIAGMQSIGGLGVFYWEPECYLPFTTYNMGAWDPTTKAPTIALTGFLNGGQPDVTPPVLQVPGTITVDATSFQGAVVTYVVTATDPDDDSSTLTITCDPASESTFPIGSTTVQVSASDPVGNTSTASFLVVVKGAIDQTKDLIALVTGFSISPSGIKTSLLSQLQTVLSDLQASDSAQAKADLAIFIEHVKAQSGKHLTTDQADQLLASALRLQAVIS